MTENTTFESWAIVELFGHQKIAGRVTEATIGGCAFLRVDVPAWEDNPPYTKFYGNGAVYAMTPVSEEIVRSAMNYIRPRPVETYMLPKPKEEPEKRDMRVCNNCGEEVGLLSSAGLTVTHGGHLFCTEGCLEEWLDAMQDKHNEKYDDEEEDRGDRTGIPF